MAIVKVRIRINAHLALTLQLCLILHCPTYPQVFQKHPVTAASGIISSPSRLIWKNVIYNVLTTALIHWFNELRKKREEEQGDSWDLVSERPKINLKKPNKTESSHSGTPKY